MKGSRVQTPREQSEPVILNHSTAVSIGIVTEKEVRERSALILEIQNPSERLRELTRLLADVTAKNWRPLLDDLIPEMERKGWDCRLALNRIGAIAGEAVLEKSLEQRDEQQNSRAQQLLLGWATAQPRLALEWFNRPPPKQSPMLRGALAFGISRSDPELAFTLYRSIVSGPEWYGSIPNTIEGAIQLGGLRRAEELYTWAQGQDFHPEFLRSALQILAEKEVAALDPGDSPERMLRWFSKHFPIDPKSRGGETTRAVISNAARLDAPATLRWLDEHADRLDPDALKESYTIWAESWQAENLEPFLAWVTANPQHPRYETVAAQAIKSLAIRGDTKRARSLLETLGNADSRANLAKRIEDADAKATATQIAQPKPNQ